MLPLLLNSVVSPQRPFKQCAAQSCAVAALLHSLIVCGCIWSCISDPSAFVTSRESPSADVLTIRSSFSPMQIHSPDIVLGAPLVKPSQPLVKLSFLIFAAIATAIGGCARAKLEPSYIIINTNIDIDTSSTSTSSLTHT